MINKKSSHGHSGVYILQNTMVVGGGKKNGCWGKKMKTEGVGEKNEKEGKREKGEKRLKKGLKTHL